MRTQDPFLDLRELKEGRSARLRRDYPVELDPVLLGGEPHEVTVLGGEVTVDAEWVFGGYVIHVELRFTLQGPCMRCLEGVEHEAAAAQTEFIPAEPEGEDEETSPFIEDLLVDVRGLAREAVILSLPEKILCHPECRGLCDICGQNLNEVECGCEESHIDPRWEVLRNLELE